MDKFTPPPKYSAKTYSRYPIIFGGIIFMLGSAFYMRKYLVFDNEEGRKMMYRSENSNAKQELIDFKRELNK